MKTVYLAGLMRRGAPQCFKWRGQAKLLLEDNFVVRDPFRGKEGEVWNTKYTVKHATNKDVFWRDYTDIRSSDIFLVNLIPFNNEPLIGTYIEMGWAWEHRIPIVAVVSPLDVCVHPFLDTMVTSFFEYITDACEHINGYYS